MICPNCRYENDDCSKYCQRCGFQLHSDDNEPVYDNSNQNTNFDYDDNYSDDIVHYNETSTFTQPPKKNNTSIIIAIVAVGVAVVAVCVCLFFFIFNKDSNSSDEVLNSSTSVSDTTTETTSTTEPTTTSTTVANRLTQNYVGLYKMQAINKINQDGYQWDIKYTYSVELDEGYVVSQTPSYREPIADNETITLYVSKGEKPTSSYSSDDYILPDSAISYVTESDLEFLDRTDLNIALNEIYARHGRKFNDSTLQSYFDGKSWYSGYIEPEDFSDSVFNKYETKNIATIDSYMKKKGYR